MRGMNKPSALRAAEYFMAVEGLAMMRRFLDDSDSLSARTAEIERITAALDEFPHSMQWSIVAHEVDTGYDLWATRYDEPNPAITAEKPVFDDLIGSATGGLAVDAACGTGRHAARLRECGYRIIGVDA